MCCRFVVVLTIELRFKIKEKHLILIGTVSHASQLVLLSHQTDSDLCNSDKMRGNLLTAQIDDLKVQHLII